MIGLSIEGLQQGGLWPSFAAPAIEVTRPKSESFGDATTNVALILAKLVGKSPMMIAEELKNDLLKRSQEDKDSFIESVTVAAPGYINFMFSQKYFNETVREILQDKDAFGKSDIGGGKRVLVEFISANPTGPIHLGNARGGPSGDALAHVLEKSGYAVDREYYVNDFGNQVRVLGHSILKDGEAQYRGDYVDALAKQLQTESFEKTPVAIGYWAAGHILESIIKPTCEKAGVHFQNWFSEKSLHDNGDVDRVLADLKEKDLAYEKEDALWFRSTLFGDDKDRVLMKSDESKSKTYTATDLAYHENKLSRGYDVLINIQGADHLSQAAVVKRFVEEVLGAKDKLHLIVTQFVRILKDGVEVKMSKRKGIYFAWDDLIEEVGKDAVRFIFTSYAPTSHINFDIDLAREQSNKNPVFYVQYAHARISGILEKAKESGLEVEEAVVENEGAMHEKEVALIRELSLFPELIEEIAQSYDVHTLPHYAIRLADKFHSFYNDCKVIDETDKETTASRLRLVAATRIVFAETLRLIGVSAPDKM